MPMRQEWITSSADNLLWFSDHFGRHVAQEHPEWRVELEESYPRLPRNRAIPTPNSARSHVVPPEIANRPVTLKP